MCVCGGWGVGGDLRRHLLIGRVTLERSPVMKRRQTCSMKKNNCARTHAHTQTHTRTHSTFMPPGTSESPIDLQRARLWHCQEKGHMGRTRKRRTESSEPDPQPPRTCLTKRGRAAAVGSAHFWRTTTCLVQTRALLRWTRSLAGAGGPVTSVRRSDTSAAGLREGIMMLRRRTNCWRFRGERRRRT